jgi:hypothetical protein
MLDAVAVMLAIQGVDRSSFKVISEPHKLCRVGPVVTCGVRVSSNVVYGGMHRWHESQARTCGPAQGRSSRTVLIRCRTPIGITYRNELRPERSGLSLLDDGHGDDRKHNVCKGLGESVLVLLTPVMDHMYASWQCAGVEFSIHSAAAF